MSTELPKFNRFSTRLRHSSHTQALALNARPVVAAVTSGLRAASVRHSSSKPKVTPKVSFTDYEIKELTLRIQDAGTKVLNAKAGAVSRKTSLDVIVQGSATLSMALAGARFANALVRALKGETNILPAYVASDVVKGVDYFATRVVLGPNGIEKNLGLGQLSSYEKALVEAAVPELQKNIAKGVKFIRG